ncbi:MAG: hypothetical protein ACREQY_08000 [Candidatus Binatia bacterium]
MLVHGFFAGGRVDLEGLSRFLDDLSPGARVLEARSLTPKEQAMLFDAAAGFRPLTLDDFVAPAVAPLREVIHYGRNSLPVFRIFEKRFCRPDAAGARELWGYNEQAFKAFTGPGYFVARQENEREVMIDYCEVPPSKPDGWPTILPNSARLSRFIYYRTRDLMRGVSRHVTIGRATREGKPMDNWFVLCRGA